MALHTSGLLLVVSVDPTSARGRVRYSRRRRASVLQILGATMRHVKIRCIALRGGAPCATLRGSSRVEWPRQDIVWNFSDLFTANGAFQIAYEFFNPLDFWHVLHSSSSPLASGSEFSGEDEFCTYTVLFFRSRWVHQMDGGRTGRRGESSRTIHFRGLLVSLKAWTSKQISLSDSSSIHP